METEIISISLPPFPDFIEGNHRIFQAGQNHPDRENLGYFDLIFVKRGTLYLTEADKAYTIGLNQLFILLPDQHHFAHRPVDTDTEIDWLHFYTKAQWHQGTKRTYFVSELPIPELHYHQRSYTIHLPKLVTIKEPQLFAELYDAILNSTQEDSFEAIWQTEERFLRFLRYVEDQGVYRDRLTILGEEISLYLEKNLDQPLDNQSLAAHFHLHSNYLAKACKHVFGKTPMALLNDLRIETAKRYLLHTDEPIKSITALVGFSSEVYFSERFKKREGLSPRAYRQHYRN